MKKQILFFVSFLSLDLATTMWAGAAEDTRLIDAIRANNPVATREAIEAGADVNLRAINRNTPLHFAMLNPINKKSVELIKILILHGARVNIKNAAGQLPLDLARGKPQFEEIQALLGETECPICGEPITPEKNFVRGSGLFGCDPRHIFHRTCLFDEAGAQRTVQCPTCRATRDEAAAAAERDALMAHYTATEAHPDAEEIRPMLPPALLINAARDGNLAQVEALLTAGGVDIDASDENGLTALMWAAHSTSDLTAVINTLLTHGANVNASDNRGETVLMQAVSRGKIAVINTLLTHGANANAATDDGMTALMNAARNNNIAVINTLLTRGANIEASDRRGLTALMWAAFLGHIEAIDTLLAHGANIEASDTSGKTALMITATTPKSNMAVIKTLLTHGANVNAATDNGLTALMIAALHGNQKLAYALLTHNANVNAIDDRGETVLAYCPPDSEIAHLLIAHGARKHG